MTPQGIIDELLVEEGLDPADPDNTAAIARDLLALNQINSYIHVFRDWEYTYVDDVVTFGPGDSFGPLPDDFLSLGRWGDIHDEADNEVGLVSMYVMRRMQKVGSVNRRVCAIWGQSLNIAAPYSVSTVWEMFYRFRPAVLDYDATDMAIPDRWKDLVVIPGLRMKLKKNKNDSRDWNGEFKAGLSMMAAEERPFSSQRRSLPNVVPAGMSS